MTHLIIQLRTDGYATAEKVMCRTTKCHCCDGLATFAWPLAGIDVERYQTSHRYQPVYRQSKCSAGGLLMLRRFCAWTSSVHDGVRVVVQRAGFAHVFFCTSARRNQSTSPAQQLDPEKHSSLCRHRLTWNVPCAQPVVVRQMTMNS